MVCWTNSNPSLLPSNKIYFRIHQALKFIFGNSSQHYFSLNFRSEMHYHCRMDKTQALQNALEKAMTYQAFLELIEQLHQEEKATSFQDNPEFYKYSVLGFSRMKRIHKKVELNPKLVEIIKGIQEEQNWIIITESWCGDASQTVPIMARLAEVNSKINLRVVLRDSNLDYMQHYTTNGSISIPVLVMYDKDWNELMTWGPRPAHAQNKVIEYKALPEPKPAYSELSTDLQKWYNVDKGVTTQEEILALFEKKTQLTPN